MKQGTEKIEWNTKQNKQLLEAILSLKSEKEVSSFLRDLMTYTEIQEFSNRLEAARLLSIKIPYITIIQKTGLSSTTIARISKWLKGSLGGYRMILSRMHNNHSKLTAGKGLSLYLKK